MGMRKLSCLFGIVAVVSPTVTLWYMRSSNPEEGLVWVGFGIIFALLSIGAAVLSEK